MFKGRFVAQAIAVPVLCLLASCAADVTDADTEADDDAVGQTESALSYCHLPAPWGGTYICSYGWHGMPLKDGTREVWVVGTDYNIWTRWQSPSGALSRWVNMGGSIRHGGTAQDFILMQCNIATLNIRRADLRYYNNSRTPPWTGWHLGFDPCGIGPGQ